ncbi:hypothetical protein [Streptomyces sp. NPDC004728]|uniref:hypothetical protein n=1 Tax=Streptomyces sp. NPDC004728 TaxID=3154289 RepID=UPI0033A8067D
MRQIVESSLFLLRTAAIHPENTVTTAADPGESIETDENLVHQLSGRGIGCGERIVL